MRISEGYKQDGIYCPWDLDIWEIANYYSVPLRFADAPSFHYKNEYFQWVIINKNLSIEKQREQFFHELSHFFKHTGSQMDMPDFKRKGQEMKTKMFTCYASIPYHMLSYINFQDPYVVNKTAEMFRITWSVAYYRLWKIKQHIMEEFTNERISTKTR